VSARPLVLFGSGDDDPEFRYACGTALEQALYLRFAPDDDVLVVPEMELGRARGESSAVRVISLREAGWIERGDAGGSWIDLCRRQLEARNVRSIQVSSRLQAGLYRALLECGFDVDLGADLFGPQRRAKSDSELELVRAAQSAAEVSCVAVIRELASAQVGEDGGLWSGGRPLTSQILMARAQGALLELDHSCPDMIIAGSPDSALPHHRGRGQIAAGRPVVIDIFPRGAAGHYHGDLTRTVVPGPIPDEIRRWHEACVAAMEAAIATIRPGSDGRDAHRACCRALVEHGFGTITPGLEGTGQGPVMIHSTGHGVGLEVHEAPLLRDAVYPLRRRDVVTVEPGLYQTGVGGVRVEDTGWIGDAGFTSLSNLPRSLDPRDYL